MPTADVAAVLRQACHGGSEKERGKLAEIRGEIRRKKLANRGSERQTRLRGVPLTSACSPVGARATW